MLILAGVEVDDSLSKFSSKSFKVMGRFKMALSVRLRASEPLNMSGLEGVVIMEDDANGTLLDLMFNLRFNSNESRSWALLDGTLM